MNLTAAVRVALLLSILCGVELMAQSSVVATASIAGQIKNGDVPASSVNVVLTTAGNIADNAATKRVTTNADGTYKFANLPAGQYRLQVLAPGYVIWGNSEILTNGQAVTLKEAETVERLDFALTKGGVITGRVTNNYGKPIIGEPVSIQKIDEAGKLTNVSLADPVAFRTDDQGNYRIYGLAEGQYVVSVGRGDGRGGPPMMQSNRTYQRTFYPNVIESNQATPIAVAAGKESTEINIQMAVVPTYTIAGRVVNAENGAPLAGIFIAHQVARDNRRGGGGGMIMQALGGVTDGSSGNDGEFLIEGVSAGSYSIYAAPNQTAGDYYSEPVTVQVDQSDLSGVEIRLQKAGSIAGTVILDGMTDPSILSSLTINAMVRGTSPTMGTATVNPNGTFRIGGLAPGRVGLNIFDARNPGPDSGLTMTRIVHNGAAVQGGIELQSGEQASGVQLHIALGNSTIRGTVLVEGGSLDANTRMMVIARRSDASMPGGGMMSGGGMMPAQVDANGKFQLNKLVAGTYTVMIMPMGRPGGGGQPSAGMSQTVVLQSGATQDVTLTVPAASLPQFQAPARGEGPGGGFPRGGGAGGDPGGRPAGNPRRPN